MSKGPGRYSLAARGITHKPCKDCGCVMALDEFPEGGGNGGKSARCIVCLRKYRTKKLNERKAGIYARTNIAKMDPAPPDNVCRYAARFASLPRAQL